MSENFIYFMQLLLPAVVDTYKANCTYFNVI